MEPILRFKADDGSDFSDWEKMTLGDVCVFVRNGYAYSSDGSRNHRYKLTRIESISGGVINDEKLGSSDEIDPRYRLVDGDILFSNINSLPYLGNVARYTNDLGEIYHGMNLLCIRPRANEMNSIFLFELLGTSRIRRYEITHAKAAVNQCSLPSSDVKAMSLYCPSLPEQRKIADLLSAVDDVITTQEAEVAAWEKRKKGVMQKLFSQEVRFKADDGSDFPDWEEQKIEDVCVLNPRTEQLDDEFYYMDLGSIDHGRWEAPEIVNKVDAPSRAQRVAAIDDVFFQSVRPYNMGHYHYVAAKDKQVVASTGYIQARMRNGSNAFLYQLFYEERFNAEVNARCTGSNYPAINSRKFGEITVALPSLPEQRKIADCLSALDDVIIKAKNELAKWQELKKGLLQQMFV